MGLGGNRQAASSHVAHCAAQLGNIIEVKIAFSRARTLCFKATEMLPRLNFRPGVWQVL